MLVIRLSRMGKKKKPMYRLTIMEKARDTYGRALEILGSYNPFTKELVVKEDRIKHWLSVGAQMSPTVNNLLIDNKVIEGEKVTASKPGKKKAEDDSEQKTDDSKKEEASGEVEKKDETPAEEKPAEEVKEEKTENSEQKTEESSEDKK